MCLAFKYEVIYCVKNINVEGASHVEIPQGF